MQKVLVAAIAVFSCTALLPLNVQAQFLRSDDFAMEGLLFPCPSEMELENTGIRTRTHAGSVRESSCAMADSWHLSAPANARLSAVRMEPRYPLLGMLIGAAAGGAVGAAMMSTAHDEYAFVYPLVMVPAGALTGLAVGLYIGATADRYPPAEVDVVVRQGELQSGPESVAVQIAEVSAQVAGDTTLVMWLGRSFVENDFSSMAPASIILSRPLWERLGGQPSLVGRTVELDGSTRVVLGVVADSSAFDARADGAVPIQPDG